MIYLEKRQLLEDFMQMIAPGVKSLIESLNDSHLNESLNTEHDLFEEFTAWSRDAVKQLLYEEKLKRHSKWDDFETVKQYIKDNNIKTITQIKSGSLYRKIQEHPDWKEELFGIIDWTYEKLKKYLKDNNVTYPSQLKKFGNVGKSAYNFVTYKLSNAQREELFPDIKREKYSSKEKAAEEVKQYENRNDLRKNNINLYNAILKHNWKDILPPISKNDYDPNGYVIYVYEDKENKYAYVGLTNNIIRRDKEHRGLLKHGEYITDSCYLYFNNINKEVPNYDIVYHTLNASEASQKEIDVYYKYRNNGWNMINSETTLGNLGGYASKWRYNVVYELARKCKKLKQFHDLFPEAYKAADYRGWLQKFTWLEKAKMSKEERFQMLKDTVEKYHNNYDEFKEKQPELFNMALKYHWISKLFPKTKKGSEYTKGLDSKYNNKEYCRTVAKQFKHIPNFRAGNYLAYERAKANGWLEEFFPGETVKEQKPKGYWDIEENTRKEASKYKTPQDFLHANQPAYKKWRDLFGKPMNWLKQDK